MIQPTTSNADRLPPVLETEFLDSHGHVAAFHLTYADGSVIKFGQTDLSGLTPRDNPSVPKIFDCVKIQSAPSTTPSAIEPIADKPTTAFKAFLDHFIQAHKDRWIDFGLLTKLSSPDATPTHRYTDLMIDIEALADTPDSAPAEIGLVFFDRDDASRMFLTYRYQPSPISAIQLGFNVTPGTLKWWNDQDMPIDVEAGEPLPDVLDEIARDIALHGVPGKLRVWSRGNAYDISILKLAYARTGKPLPWNFWNDRDVRTWLEGCRFKSPRKNNHDALQDATNQALDVIEATTAIPEPTPQVSDSDWTDLLIVRNFNRDGISKIVGQIRMSKDLQHSLVHIALQAGLDPYLHLMVRTHDDGTPPEITACAIGWSREKVTDESPTLSPSSENPGQPLQPKQERAIA